MAVNLSQNPQLVRAARMGVLDGDNGCRSLATELLRMGGSLDWSVKPYHHSAIFEASWRNNEACLKVLLEKGGNPNIADHRNSTPLHEAAWLNKN